MSEPFECLESTLSFLKSQLTRAVKDRKHPFRTPVFATRSQEGVDARMIVLRSVCWQSGVMRFYTDGRSAKCEQLRRHNKAALTFWHPQKQWQVRAQVSVQMRAGTKAEWMNLPDHMRGSYGALPSPGEKLRQPAPLEGSDLKDFFILEAYIEQLESLTLGRDLHRRCLFFVPDWDGEWCAP